MVKDSFRVVLIQNKNDAPLLVLTTKSDVDTLAGVNANLKHRRQPVVEGPVTEVILTDRELEVLKGAELLAEIYLVCALQKIINHAVAHYSKPNSLTN